MSSKERYFCVACFYAVVLSTGCADEIVQLEDAGTMDAGISTDTDAGTDSGMENDQPEDDDETFENPGFPFCEDEPEDWQCRYTDDCPYPSICTDNACVAAPEEWTCAHNSDCYPDDFFDNYTEGYACDLGACYSFGCTPGDSIPCGQNEEGDSFWCEDSEFCFEGACYPETGELDCETEVPCETYEVCAAGSCVDPVPELSCDCDSDCRPGQICARGVISEQTCEPLARGYCR